MLEPCHQMIQNIFRHLHCVYIYIEGWDCVCAWGEGWGFKEVGMKRLCLMPKTLYHQ